MKALTGYLNRAAAAAASLTGKRFGLLVASSLVATSAIVASALTGTGSSGALAALLGRNLASEAPVASGPAAGSTQPSAAGSAGSSGSSAGGPAAQTGVPLAPAPVASPQASGPSDESETAATPSTPTTPTPEAGRIKHVFVISLASPGYEASFGTASQMPYLATTLRPQGKLLSGYSLSDESGLANGIAAISGQPPNASTMANCTTYAEFTSGAKLSSSGVVSGGTGCVYPVEALTIADQLGSARFRWRAYMDGMVDETGKAHNCVHPDSGMPDEPILGGYAARHNPFIYFHSLLDLGDCAVNDVPLSQLDIDLKKADSTPNFSYISPSLCNSGVAGQCPAGAPEGASSADAFLSQLVPRILASAAYKQDGLLMITFSEANATSAETAMPVGTNPLQVGSLLLSRYASGGATDGTPYNPYSLLRSVEDLFGLSHLAKAAGTKVKSFAPALLGESGGD